MRSVIFKTVFLVCVGLLAIKIVPASDSFTIQEPQIIGTGEISSVAFAPNGREIAVGTSVGVEILASNTLQQIDLIEITEGESESIAYSPDSKKLVVSAGKKLLISNRVTGEVTLVNNSQNVNAVHVSLDGQIHALLHNGFVQTWTPDLQMSTVSAGHRFRVKAIDFSLNGKWMATGGADQKIVLRNVSSTKVGRKLIGTNIVNGIAFTADSRFLVSATKSNVRVWNVNTGKLRGKIFADGEGHNFSITTDAKRSKFAVVNSNGKVTIWDVDLKSKEVEFDAEPNTFTAVLSPSGKRLVTATPYQTTLWDVSTGRPIASGAGHYHIDGFGFSADSKRLVLAATYVVPATADPSAIQIKGDLILWDLANGTIIKRWTAHDAKITSVRFSPDGTKIMSHAIRELGVNNQGKRDHIIRLWDSQTFVEIDEIVGRKGKAVDVGANPPAIIAPFTYNVEVEKLGDAIDFKKDKTYIVLTAEDKLRLWNTHSKYHDRNAVYWPNLHRQQISHVVAKNGKITATVKGKKIELDFGAKLQREWLTDHRSSIKLLQFSFDSKYLASLSWEGGVCLVWDVENVAPPY